MKRRDVLKGAAAITVLPAGAMAESVRPPLLQVMHPYKKQTYRELYWEAQRRIDELEQDRIHLRNMSQALQIHPHDHGGAYLELTSEPDGTLVMRNPLRGTEIRL